MPNTTLHYKFGFIQQIYEQGLTSLYTNIKDKKTNVKGVSKISKNKRYKQKGLMRNDEFHITIHLCFIYKPNDN